MSGAVRPFERLKARLRPARADHAPNDENGAKSTTNGSEKLRLPEPTDLIFPKWQRELFKTILDEENLRLDREGRPRTAYSPRHTYMSAPDGRCRHLPDRQRLPHQRRDDREVLRRPHQDAARRGRHQNHETQVNKEEKPAETLNPNWPVRAAAL